MAEGGSKLSEEEIFECLKSLNVPVRMNDLKVPSREFIVRVFECFIRDLQIDIFCNELRTWEATKHIEDGDIYEEALLLIILALSVDYITIPCGLNITIKDIVEPKPKRTKKILNYLLVFWNYYLQKCARFTVIEEMFKSERKRAEDILKENESLDEKYEDLVKVLNNMQPSREELSEIVRAKEEKATKLRAECDTLLTDYQNLKMKELSLKEQISSTDLNIIRTKETLDELSQLILPTPKKKQVNDEIQVLKEKIKTSDVKMKEYETKLRDVTKDLEHLEKWGKKVENFLNSTNEMTEYEKQLIETVQSMVDIHQKITDDDVKLKRSEKDLERKEESNLIQEQKFAKVALDFMKRLETSKELLEMHQNDLAKEKKNVEFVKVAVQGAQDNIDSVSDEICKINENIKEADSELKQGKAKFESKLREIDEIFRRDCNDVIEVIKKIFPYELKSNFSRLM